MMNYVSCTLSGCEVESALTTGGLRLRFDLRLLSRNPSGCLDQTLLQPRTWALTVSPNVSRL